MNQVPTQSNQPGPNRRKPNNKKKVGAIIAIIAGAVILLALLAAVVTALVLNAVTGARQSQRNNARAVDIASIANAVDEYLSTTNQQPKHWGDIAPLIDRPLRHYKARADWNQSVNLAGSWNSLPTRNGEIPVAGNGGLGIDPARPEIATSGRLFDDDWRANDLLMIISWAGCSGPVQVNSADTAQSMVIVYRLEGLDQPICREI